MGLPSIPSSPFILPISSHLPSSVFSLSLPPPSSDSSPSASLPQSPSFDPFSHVSSFHPTLASSFSLTPLPSEAVLGPYLVARLSDNSDQFIPADMLLMQEVHTPIGSSFVLLALSMLLTELRSSCCPKDYDASSSSELL